VNGRLQTRCASLDTAVSPHGRRSRSRALPIAIYATCPHNGQQIACMDARARGSDA
jgi:hypothetical protein